MRTTPVTSRVSLLLATVLMVLGVAMWFTFSTASPVEAAPRSVAEPAPNTPLPQCVVEDGGSEGLGCAPDAFGAMISGDFASGSTFVVRSAPNGLAPCFTYVSTGCYYSLSAPSISRCVYLENGDPTAVRSCPSLSSSGSVSGWTAQRQGSCSGSLGSTYAAGGGTQETFWVVRAAVLSMCTYEVPDTVTIDNLYGPTFFLVRTSVRECIEPGGGYGCDESWATLETRTEYGWLPVSGTMAAHAEFDVTHVEHGIYSFTNNSVEFADTTVGYEWDFGDGLTSEAVSPSHEYAQPGDYTVTLTMRGADGRTDSTSRDVSVEATTLAVSLINPDAIFTGEGSGNRFSKGDEFTVQLRVEATDGVGDVAGVAPVGDVLDLPSQLELVDDPLVVAPTTYTPGMITTYDIPVRAIEGGRFTVRSTWAGTNAEGPVEETGEFEGSVSGLAITVTLDPPSFQLDQDNNDDGEITPEDNDLTVTVEIENVSTDHPVTDLIVDPLDLESNDPEHPEVRLFAQDPPPEAWPTSLAAAATATREWTYRADDEVDATVEAFATGSLNDALVTGSGDDEVKVFTSVVLEARFDLEPQAYEAGKVVRVNGNFRNVSDTTPDPIDVSFAVFPKVDANAGGGYFTTPGGATPSGAIMYQLAPGESIDLDAILQTTAIERYSVARVEYDVVVSTRNDSNRWVEVDPATVHVLEEDGYSASLFAGLPAKQPEPEAVSNWACSDDVIMFAFIGCKLAAGLVSMVTGFCQMGVMIAQGIYYINQATWGTLVAGMWGAQQTLRALAGDDAAWNRLAQEIAIDLAALRDTGYVALEGFTITAESVAPAMDRFFQRQEVLWTTGTTEQILGEMAETVGENGDMALEALVAARTLKKSMLVAAGAEQSLEVTARNALDHQLQKSLVDVEDVITTKGARAVPEERVLPSGLDVTDAPIVWRDSYGIAKQELDKLLQIAKDEGIIAAFRSRAPIAAELIAKRLAYAKPGSVPLKGVSDLDVKYLGYPSGWNGKVYLLEPPVPWHPAKSAERASAIEAYLDTFPDLTGGSAYSRDMRAAVRSRLETRLDEWPKNLKKFKAYQETGIDVGFYQEKQGMHPAMNDVDQRRSAHISRIDVPGRAGDPSRPFARRGFRLQMNGPYGILDITGDIDFLAIFNADGTIITDLVKRERIYEKLRSLLGMQHGESFTFDHASRESHLAAGLNGPGGETLLATTPTGRLVTTYFNAALSRLENVGQVAAKQTMLEGALSETLSPPRPSKGFSLDDLLALFPSKEVSPDAAIASPETIAKLVNGLTSNAVKSDFFEDGQLFRSSDDGTLEQYRQPGSPGSAPDTATSAGALTERVAAADVGDDIDAELAEVVGAGYVEPDVVGRSGGRWVEVSVGDALGDDGTLEFVPFTYLGSPTEAGATNVDVLSLAEMNATGSHWFRPGDRVVVDPGGPGEEFATIASVSPLTFAAPLQHPHYVAEMIAIPAGVPSTGGPGPGPGSDAIVSVSPARLLETRPASVGSTTVDGKFAAGGAVAAKSVTEVTVTGRGGVPGDAAAVMLNVTAVLPDGAGHVTVFPCGSSMPTASNLNYVAGQVVPNAVLAKVGAGGKVCFYSHAGVHLVVDVNGYVPAGSSVASVSPARLLETRPASVGSTTVDGKFAAGGAVAAKSVTEVTVTGRGGVPGDAAAVMLNVTAVLPDGAGHVTVFPCGSSMPTASNLNYVAGQVVPNAVLAKVGAGGKVCFYSHAGVHLVVDVNGYVPAGSSVASVSPARLLETRPASVGSTTVDGKFAAGGAVAAKSVTEVTVTGRGGVPGDAAAVMLNVTAVLPDGAGHVTVFPCGSSMPTASNLNYVAGQVVPNAVLAKVGAGGKVCFYSHAGVHLVVDVNGYVP
ncbi:PKD domain-containing protein [Ilumatobacter fluminis]|uniref:PKD domain-containing protein n=1 Tax=Ilumatobacter fluminis TaxID=467091 RepID=A0A4R7HYJ5_9ACTN|nr:PKD domain-containing protein [Ilumatobacter fluminis]TDT15306.1 PKD domain-containing protein [Ilumatobacter fluminis]